MEVDLYGGFMPNQIILRVVWLRFTNYPVRIKEDFAVKKIRRIFLHRNLKYLPIFTAVAYLLILIRKFPKYAGNFRVE